MRRYWIGLAVGGLLASAGAGAGGLLEFRRLRLDGALVRWTSARDEAAVVTHALVPRPMRFTEVENCSGLGPVEPLLRRSGLSRPQFLKELEEAFAMWERVANIRFEMATDASSAGILIGAQSEPEGRAFTAVSYVPGTQAPRPIARSLICLNPEKRWKIGFDGNIGIYDLRYTLAHEIGHAIGLDHPEPHDQLMSLRYQERFRTLQSGDIEGAVAIYGTRPTK